MKRLNAHSGQVSAGSPGKFRRFLASTLSFAMAASAVVAVSAVATVASPQSAAADPYSSPQTYSATADSFITDLGASAVGLGANLTVTKSIASANSTGQSNGQVRLIQGTLAGVTVPLTAASQSSPGNNTTPVKSGLSNFGLPGVMTINALSGTALSHGYAMACPSPDATWDKDPDLARFTSAPGHAAVYPAGSRVLSKAVGVMAGATVLGGTLGSFGAFTNYNTTTLYPTGLTPDSFGIQSTSTAEVAGISFLAGAVAFTWSGFYPYVKAYASGVPGGAGTDYSLPAVQVSVLGITQNLSPGQAYTFGVPGVGTLKVTVGQPTQNVVSADGTHAEITVPLLSIEVSTLFNAARANYDILPMHAVANMSPGTTPGIQCLPILETLTPDLGPTSGGQTVTITGENFAQGATTVTIGGITVPATVSPDGKTLTFVTPPHAPGTVPVTVTTPNGTSDDAVAANDPGATTGSYTYIAPPVITGPVNGSTTTNSTPPITGTGSPGSSITVTEGGNTVCTATVAADGTWSCTPTTPFAPGPHTITATQHTPGDPTLPGGLTQVSPPVTFTVLEPTMTVAKTAGAITDVDGNGVDVGDTITYTFSIENTGSTALNNATVTDPKISPTPFVCAATVASGATQTCTRDYSLTQADVDAGRVDNTATFSATPEGSTTPTTDTASASTPTGAADGALETAKTAELQDANGNGLADVGESIDYTITTTNTGNVVLNDVTVTDAKITDAPNNGVLTCDPAVPAAALAPGDDITCTGTYTVTQADVDAGGVSNTATATGTNPTDPSTPPTSTPGTVTTPTNDTAHLTTSKSAALQDGNGNGLADVGEQIDYTITTTNDGAVSISGVTQADAKITDAPNNGTLNCTPAQGSTLASGASMTCTGSYTVTQADVDAGSVDNTATATGATPDGDPSPSTPGTSSVPANTIGALTTTKVGALQDANGNGLADVGESIDYTITATNTGAVSLTDVSVSDPKLDAAGVALECTPAQGADLAPGESVECTATYTVTQADVDAGSVSNTATATGELPDGTPAPSTPGTSSVPTDTTGALSTTKSGELQDANDNGLADIGESIDYTITATNTGAVSLTDVTVSDPKLDAAGVALECTPAQGADLAPGESVTCTATYTVTQADVDAGSVSNTATATGVNPADPGTPPTSTPGVSEVPTNTEGALTTTKTGELQDGNGNGFADAGESIDYTITATNTGSVSLTGVTVSDPKLDAAGVALECTPGQGADLAPGDSVACTATYTVTQADVDAGSVSNTATASGTNPVDPGTPPTSTPGVSEVPTNTEGALTTTKTAALQDANGNGLADAGESIDYTITATNTGAASLTDVTVSDAKLDAAGIALECTPGQGADLAPGESVECTATYTVTQADVDSGSVSNTATATGTNPLDPSTPPTSPPGGSEVPTNPTGGLTTTKTGALQDANGNGLADVGESIDYTITATNTGSVSLTDVTVSDPKLDAAGVALECTPGQGADLAPGDSVECTATYTVTQADVDAGSVDNTATASGDLPDGGTAPSTPGTSSVPTDTTGALTTTKTGELQDGNDNGLADVGESIDYTITATNTGSVSLTDVTVSDPKLDAAGVALECTPGQGADLAPGESIECTATYTVTQADVDAGSVSNTATASGTNPVDPGTPPTTTPGVSEVPTDSTGALTTTKSGDLQDANGNGLADVGESIDYTITSTNTGSVSLTGVTVTDAKLDAAGVALDCTPGQGADLAPGESIECTATYTVTQADVDAGSVSNTATATGTNPVDPGTPPTSPPGGSEVPTNTEGALTTTKTAALQDANGNGFADAGESIDYTITATNTGAVSLTGVTVTDAKLDAAGVALECTPGQGADLAPGESVECTATYTVTQADVDSGSVSNTATATGTNPLDPGTPPTSPPGGSEVPTNTDAALTTTKTGALQDTNGNGFADVGESIDYTITATNTGSVSVTDVTISDPKLDAAGVALECTPAQSADLAPGESVECTATYTVTQADVDAGSVSNTATATGELPDGTPAPSTPGTSSVPTDTTGALTTTKSGELQDANGNGLADAGETVDYTITATNTGAVSLTDVSVSDPKLDAAGVALECTPGQGADLAPGESVACTATYTVTQADVDAGSVSNTATATGTNPVDPGTPPTSTPGVSEVPTNTEGALTTTKTGALQDTNGNGFADAGESIDYTITATNTGAVSLTDVSVTDPKLDAAGVALECTPGQGADLAPGESITCTATYTVTQADVDAGSLSNTATATGELPDGTPAPSTPGTSTVPTDTTGALSTTKTGALQDSNDNGLADAGETVDYTITSTNTGAVSLTGVTVSDAKLDAAGVALECTPGQGADLAPGESIECTATYTVTQADVDAGSVSNTATATAVNPVDPGTPPTSTPGVSEVPTNTDGALTTTKTGALQDTNGNGLADVGESIDYTITATNTGAVSLTGVTVTDAKLDAAGVALECTPAQGADLAPGESVACTATYTVTQADVDAGSVSNTATATGELPDGTPAPSTPGTSSVPTDTTGALSTTKSGELQDANGNGLADAGESIDYTITATNTGAVSLTDVTLSDAKLEAAGIALECTPGQGTDLAPGESITCTATYTVTQADVDAGSVSNTATASGTNPVDPGTPPTSPPGGSEVPTNTEGALTTTKSGELQDANDNGLADVGESIDYTITATNTGAVSLAGVTVSDPKLEAAGIALECTPGQSVDLAPGESVECTATYTVSQADIDAGSVSNTATASGTNPVDPGTPPTSPPGGSEVPTNTDGALTTTKIAALQDANGNGLADAGESIDYTITATNTGSVSLTGVTVTDAKLDAAGVALECTPGQGVDLAPGESIECTATYTVSQADIDAGSVSNTATATGTNPVDPSTPPTSPPGGSEVPTNTIGALTTTKVGALQDANGNGLADVGESIDYTITATNTGSVSVTDVSVSDPKLDAAGVALECTPGQSVDLAPGESVECTATYTVTQADVDAGSVSNTATATGELPDGTPAPSTPGTSSVPTDSTGALSTTKTGALQDSNGNGFADAGETVDYTITATNTGSVSLTDVTVSDPKLDAAGVALECTPGQGADLAPGESITCTATYTVTQADVDAGSVSNTATATGTNPVDPGTPPTSTPGVSEVPTNTEGALTTTKTGALHDTNGNGFADAGESIDYTITATNTGSVSLTGVTVADPKLEAAGIALECTPAQGADLAPGESVTCTATYTVTQDDVDAGSVSNTATATGANPVDPGTPPTSPPGESEVPTNTAGELTTTKTGALQDTNGNGFADVGESIDYTITATNTGAVSLTGVTVTDAKLDAAGVALECTPGQGADLAPGESIECTATYTVTQDDVDAGSVSNTATATGANPVDPGTPPTSPPGGSEVPTNSAAALTTTKTGALQDANGNGLADVGESIDYTITATNTGAVSLTDVSVSDPKLEAAGIALECTPAQSVDLAPGESMECTATYTVTQADVDAGSVSNTATATGELPDGTPAPSTPGTSSVPTDAAGALSTTKDGALQDTNGNGLADVGESIDYTITATNTGAVSLTDVMVSDPKLDAAGVALECTPGQGADLAPGESITCTATYTVTQADVDAGSVSNTATATATNPADPSTPPTSPPGVSEVPTNTAGALTTTKTGELRDANGNGLADVGESIDYTITATNTGSAALTGVTVTDAKLDAAGVALECTPGQGVDLAPGESIECTATYTVTQADVDAGSVSNTATATGTNPVDPSTPPTTIPGVSEVPTDSTGSLTVAKDGVLSDKDDDGKADAGESIDYTITAANTGQTTLADVVVIDTKLADAGIELECDAQAGSSLAPGQSIVCTATYVVTAGDMAADRVLNVATATAESVADPGGPQVSGEGTSTVDVDTKGPTVKPPVSNDDPSATPTPSATPAPSSTPTASAVPTPSTAPTEPAAPTASAAPVAPDEAAKPGPTGALALTGTNVLTILPIALVALLAGAVLMFFGARRRRATQR